MRQTDELLTLLLAAGDAIFVALRADDWWGCEMNANRAAAMAAFAANGVAVPSSTGPQESMERQRLLEDLAKRELLMIRRRQGLKFPLAKLTDRGDAAARRLCGLPGRVMAHAWLVRLCELSAQAVRDEHASDGLVFRGAIDEFCFIPPGEEPSPRGLALVEEFALPAMVRGWAACHSSLCGLAYYWPTEAGRLAALNPPAPDPDGKTVEACMRLYAATFARRRAALAEPRIENSRELGPLPFMPGRTKFKRECVHA